MENNLEKRIAELINSGEIKSKGLIKLKKEFGIDAVRASNEWIRVKGLMERGTIKSTKINQKTKEEVICEFIEKNKTLERDELLGLIVKTFKIQRSNARNYYSIWKKKYNAKIDKTALAVKNGGITIKNADGEVVMTVDSGEEKKQMKEVKKTNSNMEKKMDLIKDYGLVINEAKGKLPSGEEFLIKDNKIQVGEQTFNTVEDVEKYRAEEINKFMVKINEILDIMQRIA